MLADWARVSYTVNEDQYKAEKNVTRLYAQQKVWPRAVFVRRARYASAISSEDQ